MLSEVMVNLFLEAMRVSGKDRFLIDGFSRNKENCDVWEMIVGFDCDFVLFFDCLEEVMIECLFGCNEGWMDDNIDIIKKRFKTFRESFMLVINYYDSLNKVCSVNSD